MPPAISIICFAIAAGIVLLLAVMRMKRLQFERGKPWEIWGGHP